MRLTSALLIAALSLFSGLTSPAHAMLGQCESGHCEQHRHFGTIAHPGDSAAAYARDGSAPGGEAVTSGGCRQMLCFPLMLPAQYKIKTFLFAEMDLTGREAHLNSLADPGIPERPPN